jgi:cytochrome P450
MPEEIPYDPLNPYPWYRFMRANHPVYYDEQVKMWYVFSYQNVQKVFMDTKTFSSKGAAAGGLTGGDRCLPASAGRTAAS